MSVPARSWSAVVTAATIGLSLAAPLGLLATRESTYIVTRGASMQPALERGDLAVVRPADSYAVGDIAAYRSAARDRVVVHRIAAVDGDRYTFRGDANAFRDPESVPRSAIVGRLDTSLPWVGAVLLWLVSPVNTLLLTLLVLLLVDRARPAREGRQAAPVAATPAVVPDRAAPPATEPPRVPIVGMSFPHELAVIDLADPELVLALAVRYDRPVLHDEAGGLLLVLESGTMYRCRLAAAEPSLAVVRDLDTPRRPPKNSGQMPLQR